MPSPAASVATSTCAHFAKFAFGKNACARRIAVANFHAAVNLRYRQPPLAQLAEWPAVFAVAGEEVERVLMLGEDEQLHLRVFEDALLREHVLEPTSFDSTSLCFERPSLTISLLSSMISSRRAAGSKLTHVFQSPRCISLLLFFGQIVEVVGNLCDLLLPVLPGSSRMCSRLSFIRSRLRRTA